MGSEFASIGKKLLVKALGRQSNYIEELSTEIDIEASGCKECEVFFSNAGNTDEAGRCQNCEHKCYLTKKKYINEKTSSVSMTVCVLSLMQLRSLFTYISKNQTATASSRTWIFGNFRTYRR